MTEDEIKAMMAGGALLGLAVYMHPKRSRPRMQFSRPVEPYDQWTPPVACTTPVERPGTRAFADLVLRHFGGADCGITRACEQGGPSLHHEGRAWDWGIVEPAIGCKDTGRPADVTRFLDWLLATDGDGNPHAILRRAGIVTVIYNRRIWSTRTRSWRPYTGQDPHTSHIHIGFGHAGADGKTSLYEIDEALGSLGSDETPPDGPAAVELLDVRGLRHNTTDDFKRELIAMAGRLKLDPSKLAAVMSFETGGTFAPDIRNGDGADANGNVIPSSRPDRLRRAVGLIQFMPATAAALGTTSDALSRMTATEQLTYVERYYRPVAARLRTMADYYLAVFYPAALNSPGDVIAQAGSSVYEANAGLDRNKDGTILKSEAAAPAMSIYEAAKGRPPIVVRVSSQLASRVRNVLPVVVLLGAAALVALADDEDEPRSNPGDSCPDEDVYFDL